MTLTEATNTLLELAQDVVKMRKIVDNQEQPSELRYRAIVIEEGMLSLIKRYVDKIEELKIESVKEVQWK